jgi:transposase
MQVIMTKVEVSLSAQRIYQALVKEKGFTDSYQAVLGQRGVRAKVRTRRSWVLRVVLSYSRKAYREAVSTQDTETFLHCLENGLRSFGGSPLLLAVPRSQKSKTKRDPLAQTTLLQKWL